MKTLEFYSNNDYLLSIWSIFNLFTDVGGDIQLFGEVQVNGNSDRQKEF